MMEAVQRMVRSLKSARSHDLPEDPKAAYFLLLSSVLQNQHRTFVDLLGTGHNFDVNFVWGKSKRTLLHMAANVGAFECLWHLLKRGAQPNVSDRQGITPLQVASRNGFSRCISKLLEYGADIEIKNNEGMTAIHWLASNGRSEIFSDLVRYIRNIDVMDANFQTPLHVACLNGHLTTINKLLELRADIEKQNVTGCTPLFFACRHGHFEVVKVLLQQGASLKSNYDKETPIDAAFKAGCGQVCLVLLDTKRKECSLNHLLNCCLTTNTELSHVKEVLSYIAGSRICLRNDILQMLASQVRCEGLKLLSQSSNYEVTVNQFFKVIKLLTCILTIDPSQEMLRLRTTSRRSIDHTCLPKKNFFEPDNLPAIQCEIDSLWETLETWMEILQNNEDERNTKSTNRLSRELSDPDAQSLAESISSELRQINPGLQTQTSRSSEIEHLILSQPALEFRLNENSSWRTGRFSRSDSYINAMNQQADIENMTENSDSKTVVKRDLPQMVNSKNDVIEITADRLCAVIHGYYMFSQSNPTWNVSNGNMWKFDQFVEKHGPVLRLLVSRRPSLIFEHFHFVLENPILLRRFLPAIHSQPFVKRQDWFYENLYAEKPQSSVYDQSFITVVRDSLLSTSCKEMQELNANDLKRHVAIRFQGEDGMGRGVTTEWLELLLKEILNPDCALFTLSADGSTFQPNSNSSVNPDHLSYFQFAGRVMGLALYHKHLVTAYFTRSFYKHILGVPASYKDVESIDPEYSKNLQWILDNDISGMGLDIPFSIETEVFGQMQEVELKADGKSVLVTDENKFEYVQLAADFRMTKAIKPQIYAFLTGFYQFVPHYLVSLFNEFELELLMSGLPDIDLNDWKKNTTYQAGYDSNSQCIHWFWEVVESFDPEKQVELLQFVTGTSRVPWGGFSNLLGATGGQLFTICRSANSSKMLPTASTCFNMLKLPEYSSKEELEKNLHTAITCGSLGFEFT